MLVNIITKLLQKSIAYIRIYKLKVVYEFNLMVFCALCVCRR